MSATADEIETALLAPWQSPDDGVTPPEWTGTPPDLVAFDNSTFPPPSDNVTPWMEVYASAGRQDAVNIALTSNIGNPTVTVSANIGMGQGKSAARQLLDAAAALYRGRLFTAGTDTLHAYHFSEQVRTVGKDGWYRLSQQISFKSY